ncbi:uncharacterized protein LY89DRAFT_207546 [Mollisia scopiformis]|uniref:RING-type domain-containing protein n=1 Tax=Mollisia scopiformis TaxID=149040 RepID=A0A194WWU0_MOLSC|nr:uncharacterized protein LY89DRAFT_207546 [Mollisia scopiformis]KUJ12443.1 hypothetical protein LY89DRAFT_207546 [Mollisia scopiformis]
MSNPQPTIMPRRGLPGYPAAPLPGITTFPIINPDGKAYDDFLDYFRQQMPPNRKKVVWDDFQNSYWPEVRPEGSVQLFDNMLTHPDGHIISAETDPVPFQIVAGLEQALKAMDPADTNNLVARQIKEILSYWYGANSMKALDRFLDARQSFLRQWPEGDGRNLLDPSVNVDEERDLYLEWYFRRLFTRVLHLPGLLTFRQDPDNPTNMTRVNDLVSVFLSSKLLLELEHEKVESLEWVESGEEFDWDQTDPRHNYMMWIYLSREIIDTALKNAFDATKVPLGPVIAMAAAAAERGEPFDEETIVDNNVKFAGLPMLEKIGQTMNTALDENPFERLLLQLLDKENTFESSLSVEHVEDKLITKQISVIDEENVARGPFSMDRAEAIREKIEPSILKMMQDISSINRQRRNHRLFRDWHMGHRPWIKLFQIYDSNLAGFTWLAGPIRTFTNHTNISLIDDDPIDGNWHHPSSYKNLAFQLFDVVPVDLASEKNIDYLQECKICKLAMVAEGSKPKRFKPTHPKSRFAKFYNENSPLAHTVMRLLCGHHFHVTCIIGYWDLAFQYTHTCPECQMTAPLNWEIVALPPLDYAPPTPDNPHPGNTFAHNTYAHHRATLMFGALEQTMTSKKLYDLPTQRDFTNVTGPKGSRPRPGTREEKFKAGLDRIAAEYWVRENMCNLAYEDNPVRWESQRYPAGKRPFLEMDDNTDLTPQRGAVFNAMTLATGSVNVAPMGSGLAGAQALGTSLFSWYVSSKLTNLGRTLGSRYMASQYQPFPDLPNYNPDVYDYDSERILQGTRFQPVVEAAVMRKRRRTRDTAFRAAAKAQGNTI